MILKAIVISGSVAQAKIAYDKKGNIDTITYMNKDGKVVNGYLGASILGFVYDKEKRMYWTP